MLMLDIMLQGRFPKKAPFVADPPDANSTTDADTHYIVHTSLVTYMVSQKKNLKYHL